MSFAAWYRLGTAYLGRGGCSAQAMAAFERGLALKPGNKQLKEGRQKAEAEALGPAENHAPTAAVAGKGSRAEGGAGLAGGGAPLTPEASGEAAAATSPPQAAGPAPNSPRHLAEAQKALGNAAFKAGRYDEAVRCFTAALQLCPGTAVYLGNRAAAHLMARHYPDAISDSLEAVELDPGFVKGYARAGKQARRGWRGRPEALHLPANHCHRSLPAAVAAIDTPLSALGAPCCLQPRRRC